MILIQAIPPMSLSNNTHTHTHSPISNPQNPNVSCHIPMTAVSVVVPMYQESENVSLLLNEIVAALSSEELLALGLKKFEIIVVDDASRDDTLEQLILFKQIQTQAKTNTNTNIHLNLTGLISSEIRIVKHLANGGQSRAVISGVRHAKYDWIVTLDGDGQNDPKDIKNLMQAVKNTEDWILVAGHRATRKDSGLKKISSKIANSVRGFLLKDDCPDTGCGLKLFPKKLFMALPKFKNMHRFLPALAKREGAKIINIKISHRERTRGVSKYGVMNRLFVGIVDLLGVMWLVRRPSKIESIELNNQNLAEVE